MCFTRKIIPSTDTVVMVTSWLPDMLPRHPDCTYCNTQTNIQSKTEAHPQTMRNMDGVVFLIIDWSKKASVGADPIIVCVSYRKKGTNRYFMSRSHIDISVIPACVAYCGGWTGMPKIPSRYLWEYLDWSFLSDLLFCLHLGWMNSSFINPQNTSYVLYNKNDKALFQKNSGIVY